MNSTKRIRLADIFSEAADKYLAYDSVVYNSELNRKFEFSCISIKQAIKVSLENIEAEDEWKVYTKCIDLVKNSGLEQPDKVSKYIPYKDFTFKERQKLRYLWLQMLATYARIHDMRVTVKLKSKNTK